MIAAGIVCSVALHASETEPASQRNVLTLTIKDVRSAKGAIVCDIFSSKSLWLKKPVQSLRQRAEKGDNDCDFVGLPKGTYGVAVTHDENLNGKFDRNFLGLPMEGYCFSNDATGFFGPAAFEDTAFYYPGGAAGVSATIKY